MFAPGELTVGLFLPVWPYAGDLEGMRGQGEVVRMADRAGFAGVWVRDVPLHDRGFGDVGQVYDPWTYLAWLGAHTENLALATGSVVVTLRHPIDVAKQAASLDRLSGGRLVLGIATGDRASEFPAYGIDHAGRGPRFAESVTMIRRLLGEDFPRIDSPLGGLAGQVDLLPKPLAGGIPLLVTGSSRQTEEWIAEHGDGRLLYPGVTATAEGPAMLGAKISAWRGLVPSRVFKPVVTNEWLDLAEDPDHPPTPLRGGFVLRTGRNGLIDLLGRWRDNGVNHAALGVQHGRRPAADTVAEIAEEVLPLFPALPAPAPATALW
ncbi:LLM class oxidoreductase [Actinosynnema sp. CS-041913]|uniref:LLM class oxidoreductase n=1 Tax=Actinosynnema sp. CS-041913 TaxID=3239917 RepID=UPI003D8A2676